eukprot:RCo008146
MLQSVFCSVSEALALLRHRPLLAGGRSRGAESWAVRLAAKVAVCQCLGLDLISSLEEVRLREPEHSKKICAVVTGRDSIVEEGTELQLSLSHDSEQCMASCLAPGFGRSAVGVDLCIASRIERILQVYGDNFLRHAFSVADREVLSEVMQRQDPAVTLAVAWATKEAVLKTLGGGFPAGRIRLKSFQTAPSSCNGYPDFRFSAMTSGSGKVTASTVVPR